MRKWFLGLSLCCSSAIAQNFNPPTWSADVSYGTSIITLGTNEYRRGSTFGFELAWPARLAKFAKWKQVQIDEVAGAKVILTDVYGRDGSNFLAGWLSFGMRLTYSNGEEYSPYMEFGSGVFLADQLTGDISTRANFASFAGAGMYLHTIEGSPRIGIRWIHISNAGTGGSNGGVNLLQATLGMKL